jgi:MFS family permease
LLPEIAFGVVFCGLCAVLGGLAGLCFGSMLACMFVGVPGYMGEEWGLALAVNALGGLGGAALGGIIGLVTALRRGRKHVVAICLLLAAALLFGLNWAVHSAMTRAKEAERRWGSLNGVVAQASRVALPANSDTSDEPHDAGGRHHPTGGRPTKWESPQHSPRSAACFCSLAPAFSRAAGAGRAAEAPKRVLTEALPELRREGKPAPLSTAPLRQETQRR